MGRKISATHRRLGLPVLTINLETLKPNLPFELRNRCQDVFGWNRVTPIKLLTKQKRRLINQFDIQILHRLKNFIRAQGFKILRIRVVNNISQWTVHLFVFKPLILHIKTSRRLWLQLSKSIWVENKEKILRSPVTGQMLTISLVNWISKNKTI